MITGKLLRVGGMRRCYSPAYTPRGYIFKGRRARPSRGVGRGHRAVSSLSGGGGGRRRVNTAPRPGPEEVEVRVPPWASIYALEMIRPIPAPPLSRLRAAPRVEAFEDASELARWDALAVIGDVDERGGRPPCRWTLIRTCPPAEVCPPPLENIPQGGIYWRTASRPSKYTPGGYMLESSIAASHRPVGAFP